MPDRLHRALERLEAVLAAQGHPVVDGLQPGIKENEVRGRLAQWGLDPPEDLITYFGWHNGYVTPAGRDFHGEIGSGVRPMSLAQACQAYEEGVRFDLETLVEHTGWADGTEWFPVVVSTSGRYVLMDCRRDTPSRGSVAGWENLEMTEPQFRPATLAQPVEWWAEYFETGVWRWDPTDGGIVNMLDFATMPEERLRSQVV